MKWKVTYKVDKYGSERTIEFYAHDFTSAANAVLSVIQLMDADAVDLDENGLTILGVVKA